MLTATSSVPKQPATPRPCLCRHPRPQESHQSSLWCIVGIVAGMFLLFPVLLLGNILELVSGERLEAHPIVYLIVALFVGSLLGTCICQFIEHVKGGKSFGRREDVNERLEAILSSIQRKKIKHITADVLKIGPTIRDRIRGIILLGLPILWYSLLLGCLNFRPEYLSIIVSTGTNRLLS